MARPPRPSREAPAGAASEPAPRALSELAVDRPARVVDVDGDPAVARRLRDLGFLPGTAVRLVRRAPLGDPAVYALRGTQFCLRRSEAGAVRVREEPGAPGEPAGSPR